MDDRTSSRKRLQVAVASLVTLVAVVAVIGGMVHATTSLRAAAAQPTPPLVSTVAPTSVSEGPKLQQDTKLTVQGTQIVAANGKPVELLGATDFSLEFSCVGGGHFQMSDFQAMRRWGMNTVRITLSSAFWRNLDGKCPNYVATVTSAVANAEASGMYVILALQWDAPFSLAADATHGGAQCPLPDATYDVKFWQDIAEIYQNDPRVLFDLFSEPHDIDWQEWLSGGRITSACFEYAKPQTYSAIGMPELAAKVRAIAPSNLIILSGTGWGYDLSGIRAAVPTPLANVIYGTHPFNHGAGSQQPSDWQRAFGAVSAQVPVIATEFGSYDCQTSYIATAINYFEQHHMSFVAWAWTPGSCATPSLLANWSGAPSAPYGAYIRQQMLQQSGQGN